MNLDSAVQASARHLLGLGKTVVFLLLVMPAEALLGQLAPLSLRVAAAEALLPDAPQAQAATQQSADSPALLPGSIHGVVVSQDGTVYEGVRVTLAQTAIFPAPVQAVKSDSSGRFSFTGVPPGPFKITISSEGFTAQAVSGVLHPGESYEAKAVVLPLNSASSEVRVIASQEDIAQAQITVEEKQRVFGVLPNFYVSYAHDAAPLTKKQKFMLAWKSSIDPVTFGVTALVAGVEQADDAYSGYGQGTEGYAKRYGANYADDFISTMVGGAILPSLLKQDPRYFYKGTGTVRSRVLYALATAVICKGDNGNWQPNYSGILGSLAAGGVSNLYYPAANRNGVTLTFQDTLIGIGSSAAQNLFQEFIVRKLTPRLPNYGSSKP